MERDAFAAFVEESIRQAVALAAAELHTTFPDRVYLRWWPHPQIVTANIAEAITAKVYEGANAIRPCVDLGVIDIEADGTPVVAALIAGYPSRPFGNNWKGTVGPFIYIIGTELLSGNRPAANKALGFKYLLPTSLLHSRHRMAEPRTLGALGTIAVLQVAAVVLLYRMRVVAHWPVPDFMFLAFPHLIACGANLIVLRLSGSSTQRTSAVAVGIAFGLAVVAGYVAILISFNLYGT